MEVALTPVRRPIAFFEALVSPRSACRWRCAAQGRALRPASPQPRRRCFVLAAARCQGPLGQQLEAVHCRRRHHAKDPAPSAGLDFSAAGAAALLVLAGGLCPSWALAEELAAAYNPEGGSETLKTVAGVAYIVVVVLFFVRLFKRRAQKATNERIASVAGAAAYGADAGSDDEEEDEEEAKAKAMEASKVVTPLQAVIGAAQAGFICYLLLQACGGVDAFFDRQPLPDPSTQYTAHNVAVLVQTVCRGLVYLITFIFGANALGLAGLTVQLLLFPESGAEGAPARPRAPRLPRVSLTDDLSDLRRAFDEAERMGRQQAAKDLQRPRGGADDPGA